MGRGHRIAALLALPMLVAACTSGGGHAHKKETEQTLTLQAVPLAGGTVSPGEVQSTVSIFRQRLDAAHLTATLSTEGDHIKVVSPASRGLAVADLVRRVGALSFRQVLGTSLSSPSEARPEVPKIERSFATYDCEKALPPMDAAMTAHYLVACDSRRTTKYLLGPAAVSGAEVTGANAVVNSTTNDWLVELSFSKQGSAAWFDLTKRAYEADPDQTQSTCQFVNLVKGCNEIGIVLDGVVLAAPSSEQDGIAGGQTQIAGNLTKTTAQTLAAILRFKPLPVAIVVQSRSITRP